MMAHRDAAVLGDPHRSREARPVAERPRVDARFVLHVLREFERAHHRQDVSVPEGRRKSIQAPPCLQQGSHLPGAGRNA